MKRNLNSALVSLALLTALVPACKKKEEAPPPPPPAVLKPKPAAPAAVQKPVSSAVKPQAAANPFDFKNRRDPFKPVLPESAQPAKTEPSATPRPTGDLLPIQSYEAGKFKVTGIVAGLKQNQALLVDPQGRPYVVHEGMEVGSNGGHVSRITSTSVEILERFKDDHGRVKKRIVVLTLPKKR